jgi:hypothetical protein
VSGSSSRMMGNLVWVRPASERMRTKLRWAVYAVRFGIDTDPVYACGKYTVQNRSAGVSWAERGTRILARSHECRYRTIVSCFRRTWSQRPKYA